MSYARSVSPINFTFEEAYEDFMRRSMGYVLLIILITAHFVASELVGSE